MATSQIASMLDELMGRNRNFAPDDANARELKWSDPEICRYYIVQFCPHDLFTNTKMDLGPCGKIHDDVMKAKFDDEKDSYKKNQFVDDFLRFCQRMLSDLSSRIKKAKERLALTQERDERSGNDGGNGSGNDYSYREMEEKIILLSEKISALVQEAETAGCQGQVEEAQGLLKLSDSLREEREQLKRLVSSQHGHKDEYGSQQKAMEVCDVCGAFLIVGDAQQRIDDHLLGKQHLGYARLRAAVDKIMEDRRKQREEREKEMEDRRKRREEEAEEERRKRREKTRDVRGGRSGVDRRHRSRSRDKRRASRSRSRDRTRRQRSRDRPGRGRSRDGRRRSRSRSRKDRSRSRSRGKRTRSSRSRSRRRSDNRGGRKTPDTNKDRIASRSRSKEKVEERKKGSNVNGDPD